MAVSGPAAPNARAVAHALLGEILDERRPLDEALAASAPFAALPVRDRTFCRLLVAGTLRRLGRCDRAVAACLDRGLPRRAADLRNALRLGAAQILFLGTPPHAAVNETVSLISGRSARYRGLANAVLKRLAREGAGRWTAAEAARIDTPGWLWRSWAGAYGEGAALRIARAHMADPPLDITVKRDPAAWAGRLEAEIMPTGTLRRRPAPVAGLPGFADGAWWVQDMAASLAALAVAASLPGGASGRRVADLCAAPGGKTAQLAAAGARVTALDISAARLERMAGNLRRLGLAAEAVEADLRSWTPERPFDAVLLDAPCTGTGTLRRRPDIARLKGPDDVGRMAALQGALLDAAARCVRPGGWLVYSVCSLQPEEGPEAAAAFLARDARFARAAIAPSEIPGAAEFVTPSGDLRTLPCDLADRGGIDGFYVSRMRRAA